jgi:hypothetical protein
MADELQGRKVNPADKFEVDRQVSDASVDEYDALLLPGGCVNPDKLRMDEDAVSFVREFVESGKPAGVICAHRPPQRGRRGGGPGGGGRPEPGLEPLARRPARLLLEGGRGVRGGSRRGRLTAVASNPSPEGWQSGRMHRS